MDTAANFLSRLKSDPNEKIILKTREDVPTQPIEVNIESTGIVREDPVFFQTDDVELPSKEELWQRQREKRNAVHTEPPIITVFNWHMHKHNSAH